MQSMKIGFRPLVYSILLLWAVSASTNPLVQIYHKNYSGDQQGISSFVSEHKHLKSDEEIGTLAFFTEENKDTETGACALILRYGELTKTVKMYVSNGQSYKNAASNTVSVDYRFDEEQVFSIKGSVDQASPEFIEINLTDEQLDDFLTEFKTAKQFNFSIDDKAGTIPITLPMFENELDLADHAVEDFQYRIGKIEDDPTSKHELALDKMRKKHKLALEILEWTRRLERLEDRTEHAAKGVGTVIEISNTDMKEMTGGIETLENITVPTEKAADAPLFISTTLRGIKGDTQQFQKLLKERLRAKDRKWSDEQKNSITALQERTETLLEELEELREEFEMKDRGREMSRVIREGFDNDDRKKAVLDDALKEFESEFEALEKAKKENAKN